MIHVGVGPIQSASTGDPAELQAFYHEILNLTADGGGDFPEYALDGMLQGLLARTSSQNGEFPQYRIPGDIVLPHLT